MGKDSGIKCRKEKRKEARLDRNKKKFDSCVQHHQIKKMKKTSKKQKAEYVQKNIQIVDEKDFVIEDSRKLQETSKSKQVKRKKNVEEKLETEFDEFMEMGTRKDNIFDEEEAKLERKRVKKLKVKDINISLEPTRKKKTKFEKYLELETQNSVASAKEDLALERKHAKKLKVKKGKLGGDDDELNMLFDGISFVFDSLDTKEITDTEEASRKKIHKKKPKKNSVQKVEPEPESETEPEMTSDAELDSESNPTQTPVVEKQAKYMPPQLRSMSRNESEEYSQVCKRVRGMQTRVLN